MNPSAIVRRLKPCIASCGIVVGLFLAGCSQSKVSWDTSLRGDGRTVELKEQEIQVGCSMCIYKMTGSTDCELAAFVNGKAYLVEGSGIDDHGDAHAPDGLCNTARTARASGRIEGKVFRVSDLAVNDSN